MNLELAGKEGYWCAEVHTQFNCLGLFIVACWQQECANTDYICMYLFLKLELGTGKKFIQELPWTCYHSWLSIKGLALYNKCKDPTEFGVFEVSVGIKSCLDALQMFDI